jgi:DNA-binding transcriptional MerR regulator
VTDVTDRDLTIDGLARTTGMTVRNLRAHQSRGLLPPPEVRGRTGYYGPEHVARIELIRELQAEGFNLEAIRRLLEGANGSTGEVLRFTRALKAPFEDEEPDLVDAEELARQWGDRADPRLLKRAVELGVLRPIGEGVFEVPSPRLARAGAELAALGISPHTALDVAARVRRSSQSVADTYVRLFLDEVWKPFDEAGRPQERWPEIRDALERLRPLAAETLLAMFQLVMSEAVEGAFGRQLERDRPTASGRRSSDGRRSRRSRESASGRRSRSHSR